MKFFKPVLFSLFLFAANINPLWAQDEIQMRELLEELRTLKTPVNRQEKRIAELEARLSGKEKGQLQLNPEAIEELDKHIDSHLLHRIHGYRIFDGLRIGLGATSIIQGAYNANGDDLTTQAEDVTDASYSVDLEFEKKFKDFGLAYIHLETGDGAGVEDGLKVFSNVNRDVDDSDNSVSLTEVWYEHYFNKFPITLTLGKIDPTIYIDNNRVSNDETTQFLGRMFRNSPDMAGRIQKYICQTRIFLMGVESRGKTIDNTRFLW